MNDTQPDPAAAPDDPAMAASDPGMFASLTYEEGSILYAHLRSGVAKQSAVHEPASGLWKDGVATLGDVLDAQRAALKAENAALYAQLQAWGLRGPAAGPEEQLAEGQGPGPDPEAEAGQ